MDEIRIPIFKSFEGCVFPGDIEGYILPVTIRTIFRLYVDVPNNDNPFLIALTQEGYFICKHKDCNYWVTINSLPCLENCESLRMLGTLEYEGVKERVWECE
jgi:hypothetical protein